MLSHMCYQIGALTEAFATNSTLMRFFTFIINVKRLVTLKSHKNVNSPSDHKCQISLQPDCTPFNRQFNYYYHT